MALIEENMTASDIDLLETLLPEYYNPSTVSIRLKELDWDEEYRLDMLTGKGFIANEKPFDKMKKKNLNGIHSPRFGTSFEDDNAFAERYRCECGKLIGKIYEGEICKECGTKVQFTDTDLKIFAWYHINNGFKIIQPAMYKKLEAFIGKTYLPDMIEFKYEMDLNGYYQPPDTAVLNKNPFYGIGMVEFRERLEEILEWTLKKKKNKQALYENILENKDKIFASNIPIYSSVLRQVFLTDEDYSYTNIDKKYNSLMANINMLNKEKEYNVATKKTINLSLWKAQRKINTIYSYIFNIVNQKEGHIRENILGGRINFSARNVIIPDTTLRAHQIRLPYLTFLELYKPEIINIIMKRDGVELTQATNRWSKAQMEFSESIYEIMNYILKNTKGKVKCLVNRNPTINYGSIVCCEVKSIKRDYDDLTMSLSAQILEALNADFDGDTLNIISLKSNEFKKEFSRVFDPRNTMFISKNDGYCQGALIKDQILGFSNFCIC